MTTLNLNTHNSLNSLASKLGDNPKQMAQAIETRRANLPTIQQEEHLTQEAKKQQEAYLKELEARYTPKPTNLQRAIHTLAKSNTVGQTLTDEALANRTKREAFVKEEEAKAKMLQAKKAERKLQLGLKKEATEVNINSLAKAINNRKL